MAVQKILINPLLLALFSGVLLLALKPVSIISNANYIMNVESCPVQRALEPHCAQRLQIRKWNWQIHRKTLHALRHRITRSKGSITHHLCVTTVLLKSSTKRQRNLKLTLERKGHYHRLISRDD